MMHQQWVSCSRHVLLNVLLVSGVNVYHLRSCYRRTFWAHNVIQIMWCDTCDLLRYNNCYSCCLYSVNHFCADTCVNPVWIHCCKWSKYDFCISQGSVATVLRWGGLNYSHSCQVFRNVAGRKLSKLTNVSRSYSIKTKGSHNYESPCRCIKGCAVSYLKLNIEFLNAYYSATTAKLLQYTISELLSMICFAVHERQCVLYLCRYLAD